MDLYDFKGEESVRSPQLVYHVDLIRHNTRHLVEMAGSTKRLFPHVKSHKIREMVRMQIEEGIHNFKCSVLSELQMVAMEGGERALLAYPLVGPAVDDYLTLCTRYPQTELLSTVDDVGAAMVLSSKALAKGIRAAVLIDVDPGMHRTGRSYEEVPIFAQKIMELKGLELKGLHCYDGFYSVPSLEERKKNARALIVRINSLKSNLLSSGMDMSLVVVGGSGTFPIYATESDFLLSPGTLFINDWVYESKFPDLVFTPAGEVLARVVSCPDDGYFTIDLGTKAIGAGRNGVSGRISGMSHIESVFQNEEHWVFRMEKGHENERPIVGTVVHVVPWHICPTTNLYPYVLTVEDRQITGSWDVYARFRGIRA